MTNVADAPHRTVTRPPLPGIARLAEYAAGAALVIVATVHLLDLSGKFSEVPYLGVAYVILIVGSIVAMALLIRRDERGWWLGGALTLGTLVSFVLSRTTGLPGATDDIGNWSEPLGLWAVVAEAAMVALTAWMLARTRRSAA